MCDHDKTPATPDTKMTASQAFESYRREHPIRYYVGGFIGIIVAVFRKRP